MLAIFLQVVGALFCFALGILMLITLLSVFRDQRRLIGVLQELKSNFIIVHKSSEERDAALKSLGVVNHEDYHRGVLHMKMWAEELVDRKLKELA